MAVKTIRLDDLDHNVEATQTVVFALEAEGFEIDLGDANVEKLRKALAPFIKAARPISLRDLPRRAGLNSNGYTSGEGDQAVARAWAQRTGKPVNDRGRVSEDVLNAWRAAGSPTS